MGLPDSVCGRKPGIARGVAAGRLGLRFIAEDASSSSGSGSDMTESEEEDTGRAVGLASGETKGDVCRLEGTVAVV